MEPNARGNGSSREKASEPSGRDAEPGQGSGQSTEPVGWREETAARPAGEDVSSDSSQGGTAVAAPESDTGEAPAPDEGPKIEVIERDSSMRALLISILPEIALLIAVGYAFYLAGNFQNAAEPGQLGPGFWPRIAAVGMAIALVARIIQAIRARHRPIVKVTNPVFDADEDEAPFDYTRVAIAMGLAVGYVFATMFLGYLFATAVFLTVFIWIGGQRRWFVPLIACAMALVSTVVFVGIVYVALPTGVSVFDTMTVAIYELLGLQ
jgi:putative tricarboxylic transport membrane protein